MESKYNSIRQRLKKHMEDANGPNAWNGNNYYGSQLEADLIYFIEKETKEIKDLLERAHWLVGNPATNISASTDIACDNWQNDYKAFVL